MATFDPSGRRSTGGFTNFLLSLFPTNCWLAMGNDKPFSFPHNPYPPLASPSVVSAE
jgi:hypothetical protein